MLRHISLSQVQDVIKLAEQLNAKHPPDPNGFLRLAIRMPIKATERTKLHSSQRSTPSPSMLALPGHFEGVCRVVSLGIARGRQRWIGIARGRTSSTPG